MENEPVFYQKEHAVMEPIVPFDKDAHYDAINSWWGAYYKGDCLPVECLPDTGAVAIYKGVPAAAAFLYKSNAKMAHIHFACANPELGAGRKVFFLRAVIKRCIEMGREFLGGEGFIWCCTDHAVVGRIYTENGMFCAGEGDTFFLGVGNESEEFLK